MGLRIDVIYVLKQDKYPFSKTYYRLINSIGDYQLEDSKRYPFKYWNKFGTGITWKDDKFLADLIPASFVVQVLYSAAKRT